MDTIPPPEEKTFPSQKFYHQPLFGLAVILVAALALIGVAYLANASFLKNFDWQAINLIKNNSEKFFTLGTEFRINNGETRYLRGTDASLTIARFINSPCPEGAQCVWSGLAVNFEIRKGDTVCQSGMGNPSWECPLDVFVKESDYQTYAVVVVSEPTAACDSATGLAKDECWRNLAKRFGTITYCNSVSDPAIKDSCVEAVAEQKNDGALCQQLSASPTQYCQYLKAIEENDVTMCAGITSFEWLIKCYKGLADKSAKGLKVCDTLEQGQKKVCQEAIKSTVSQIVLNYERSGGYSGTSERLQVFSDNKYIFNKETGSLTAEEATAISALLRDYGTITYSWNDFVDKHITDGYSGSLSFYGSDSSATKDYNQIFLLIQNIIDRLQPKPE